MPLTSKGKKILSSMRSTYGSEKKAKSVFYASINAGKIKGAEGKAEGGRVAYDSERLPDLGNDPNKPHPAPLQPLPPGPFMPRNLPDKPFPRQRLSERAAGGPVGSYLTGEKGTEMYVPDGGGTPRLLGQNGPEVFAPSAPGTIIPNHELTRLARKYGGRVTSYMRARGGRVG